MITSSRQYREAQKDIERLNQKLECSVLEGVPPVIVQADNLQTIELITQLRQSIDEYDRIIQTPLSKLKVTKPSELLLFPIWYRLATKSTLDDFAGILNTSRDQIMRWEKTEYRSINSEKLADILDVLHLRISAFCYNTAITH